MKNTPVEMTLWRCEVTMGDIDAMRVRTGFIVMMRSNLLGAMWTYKRLAEWFGVTAERIRQIEVKAMRRACRNRHNCIPFAYRVYQDVR